MEKQEKSKKKQIVAEQKKKLALKNSKKFKEKYFEFYDDVKSNTHDVYDW